MKLHTRKGVTTVTLSRRNLLSLLQKLRMPGSQRTLVKDTLVVRAEPDDQHYAGRPEPPGQMHPVTEDAVKSAIKAAEGLEKMAEKGGILDSDNPVSAAKIRLFVQGIRKLL